MSNESPHRVKGAPYGGAMASTVELTPGSKAPRRELTIREDLSETKKGELILSRQGRMSAFDVLAELLGLPLMVQQGVGVRLVLHPDGRLVAEDATVEAKQPLETVRIRRRLKGVLHSKGPKVLVDLDVERRP